MKHTLIEEIDCGETTCASEPGKFCKFFGSFYFGQKFCCLYFRDKTGKEIELFDGDNGWSQRCPACLDLFLPVEKKEESETFFPVFSAEERKALGLKEY